MTTKKKIKKVETPTTKAKQPIRLRTKKLANGNLSIYMDIYKDGTRVYEFLKLYLIPEVNDEAKATNAKTIELAETIKAKKIVELNTSAHGLSNNKERSKILLRDYLSAFADKKNKSTKQSIQALIYHLKKYKENDIQMGKIDKNYILGFIDYLEDATINHTNRNKGKTLSKNSQAMYFKMFRMALDEAVCDDVITINPILSIRKKKRPSQKKVSREYLTEEELQKFAATDFPNDLVKRAFMIGCLTGLRHSDIRQMTWAHVGVVKDGIRCICITQEKTDELVTIPLNTNILKWLPEKGDSKKVDLVFKGLITLGRTNEVLPKWAIKAGINKHLTFHISRHTFAVMAINRGIDIYVVSELLGHQNVQVTQVYTEVLDKTKQEAMAVMNKVEI